MVLRWQVNVLPGEEEALALGTPVSILRLVLVAAAALLVAAVVSVAVWWADRTGGSPHAGFCGNNHKLTLPLSFSPVAASFG